jgi:ProP effector
MTYAEVRAAFALLSEKFPECFAVFEQRRRPLKIGIHRDILARLDGALTPRELSSTLGCYTANPSYRRRLLEGATRIDLDGNVAGTVTAAQEAVARSKIASAKARAAARKQSQKQKAGPPAQPAQQPATKRDGLSDLRAAAQQRRKAERSRDGDKATA